MWMRTKEGPCEPRRDIVSQWGTSGAEDGQHNRCCSRWLHRNAPGLPRQQNGLGTCLSRNIHPGWFVSPDTWRMPSITIGGQAGDGTKCQAEHNLTFQHPHHPSPCWSSSESVLHNRMKRAWSNDRANTTKITSILKQIKEKYKPRTGTCEWRLSSAEHPKLT